MIEERDVLLEFEKKEPERSRYFLTLILIFIAYIFIETSIFMIGPGFTLAHHINWRFLIIFLLLPVGSLPFFTKRYLIGWILSLFYYQVITLLLFASFLQDFMSGGYRMASMYLFWRFYAIIVLAIASVVLLVTKDIRIYFHIPFYRFQTILVASSTLAILFLMIMLKLSV